MKKFEYVNDIGVRKILEVDEPIEGKYPVTLWSAEHGEYCGHGLFTKQELNDYLEHYNISERL